MSSMHRTPGPVTWSRCLAVMLGVWLLGCEPPASTQGECGTDSDCGISKICVNLVCVDPFQPVACSDNRDCDSGQICGQVGLCEDEPPTIICSSNDDCPLEMYCNLSLAPGTCVRLQGRFCRSDAQCTSGLHCSAPAGGIGRCVQCASNWQCPSGLCRADFTCVPLNQDAGIPGSDAGTSGQDAGDTSRDAAGSSGWDAGGSSAVDDPYCGAETQRCCSPASPQTSACDMAGLTCLYGFPGANDAHCWRSCNPEPCQTLEGEAGMCRVAQSWQGVCIGTVAYTCSSNYDCLYLYGQGECVAYSAYEAYCFAMDCNWEADCGDGYYCSARDNGLCLSTSMM